MLPSWEIFVFKLYLEFWSQIFNAYFSLCTTIIVHSKNHVTKSKQENSVFKVVHMLHSWRAEMALMFAATLWCQIQKGDFLWNKKKSSFLYSPEFEICWRGVLSIIQTCIRCFASALLQGLGMVLPSSVPPLSKPHTGFSLSYAPLPLWWAEEENWRHKRQKSWLEISTIYWKQQWDKEQEEQQSSQWLRMALSATFSNGKEPLFPGRESLSSIPAMTWDGVE